MDSHLALQIAPPKSQSLVSSEIFVSHSLDSHDSVIRKTNHELPAVNIQDPTSRLKAVNTTFKEVKPVRSLIILNLEESKDDDPAKRHAHDLRLVESAIGNVHVRWRVVNNSRDTA